MQEARTQGYDLLLSNASLNPDRELAKEIGLTMLRAGGNPVSPFNWKKGFGGKGADWFYQNEGTETAPESTLISVDLPAPLSPSIATTSPW